MDDLPWLVFSKTGSIETYLLMKEHSDGFTHDDNTLEEAPIDQFDNTD